MFIPHGRENAELREARFASDQIENTLIFVRLEAVSRDKFRRDVALIEIVMEMRDPVAGCGTRKLLPKGGHLRFQGASLT